MTQAQKMQQDLNGTQIIKLDYPINIVTSAGQQQLTELSVRRVTVGDLRFGAHLKTDAEQELAMMSRITGLIPDDLDLLDLADYQKLQLFFRQTTD